MVKKIKISENHAENRKEHGAVKTKSFRPDEWKVLGWENNMFYQWMKYSARQVSDQACITCFNSKRKTVIIKPLPGFGDGRCDRSYTCLTECALKMATGARKGWTNNGDDQSRRGSSLSHSSRPQIPWSMDDRLLPILPALGEALNRYCQASQTIHR